MAFQLRQKLSEDRTNLELAKEMWRWVDGTEGYDVRTGRLLVEVFRAVALSSEDGMSGFLSELSRLVQETGEVPSKSLLDPLLENAMRLHIRSLHGKLRDHIEWILNFTDEPI